MSETGALSRERIEGACEKATRALLAEMNSQGHWTCELSSSALSTATAVTALSITDRAAYADQISAGLQWLVENQNADGGWGDTVLSKSNISTTALCWASFGAAQADNLHGSTIARAEDWLSAVTQAQPLTPAALAGATMP